MSWHYYKQLTLFAFAFLVAQGCTQSTLQNTIFISHQKEDEMILHALDYRNGGDYTNASRLFMELANTTKKQEYAKEAILTLLSHNQIAEAKVYIQTLSDIEKLFSFATLGYIYEKTNDFAKASFYYQQDYQQNKTLGAFISFNEINFFRLNQKDASIQALQSYQEQKGFNIQVAMKQLHFYESIHNTTKILDTLYLIWNHYKSKNEMMKAITVKKAIEAYLATVSKDYAILFLEERSGFDDMLLLGIYRAVDDKEKANHLLMKLFHQTKDYSFLGQSAILDYEMLENKNKQGMQSIIGKFDEVVAFLDKAEFNNYYGYLLIDHDVDYLKGIELVKKALLQEKDNFAYIDSLAWGYYKNKQCTEAKKVMQRIDRELLSSDDELKSHWEQINTCKGK